MFLFAYAFPCFQTKLDKKLVQHKQTRETHIMFQAWISVSANIGPKISVIGISVNFHIGASLYLGEVVSKKQRNRKPTWKKQ